MAGLNVLAKPLDRFASLLPKLALSRAKRLSETAPQRAFALFATAAEAGDAEAAFAVGERYLDGKGTLRQPFEAARWYHRAAEAGHARAQCRLAQLHLVGLAQGAVGPNAGLFDPVEAGVADYYAAVLWARRAAEAGASEAQALLAYILTSGPEELRDPDAAFEWYRKSAEQDCPQGRLGYVIGLMQRADTADKAFAAHDELVQAAEAGLPTAYYLLGLGAERGIGTKLGRGRGATALQGGGRSWARQRPGEARLVAARRPRRRDRSAERRKLASPRCSWRRLRGGGAPWGHLFAGRPVAAELR